MASNQESISGEGGAPSSATGISSQTQPTELSQTALDYLHEQQRLEEDAREALPYSFDHCTQPLGPLRQTLFSCLTCNPPPATDESYTAAGICYSCSISCHGEHRLVELFHKRDFVCDCGTTRIQSDVPCNLRIDAVKGRKGRVKGETPREGNRYDHNFKNRFCECDCEYDPHDENGTMYQCMGLSSEEDGGCGEDWYHPSCLVGLGPNWTPSSTQNTPKKPRPVNCVGEICGETVAEAGEEDDEEESEAPLPPGFPKEDDFEYLICWKCVEANPWIKRYANSSGALKPSIRGAQHRSPESDSGIPLTASRKRKREDDGDDASLSERSDTAQSPKRPRPDGMSAAAPPPSTVSEQQSTTESSTCKYDILPEFPADLPSIKMSLFCTPTFRDTLCRCPTHFPLLSRIPQLLEDEEIHQYDASSSHADSASNPNAAGSARSVGSASLYERGEAALAGIDRVKAIEGMMVFNRMKDGLMKHLKPFAEEGKAVSAEDVREIFVKLRGDQGMTMPGARVEDEQGIGDGTGGGKGQAGY